MLEISQLECSWHRIYHHQALTALPEGALEATVVAAGFVDFEITWRADVFSGAPRSSSAGKFGTLGINFLARRARDEEEWREALARLSCER